MIRAPQPLQRGPSRSRRDRPLTRVG